MTTVQYLSDADFNSQGRITNLLDATNPQDAATLNQLQAMVRGLDWKNSVRAASTANVNLASPGTTLDGVTLAANDRVLLKDQTAGAENGIWVWTASGSALTRAVDADANVEVTPNMTVAVEEGTANADKWYQLTTNGPITVGTTSLTFTNIGSGTTGFTVSGAGLTGSGTTVDVGAGTGIIANANDVAIDTTVVVRKATAVIGDGSTLAYTVTHGLNNAQPLVQVKRTASPFDQVNTRVEADPGTPNAIIVRFNVAPSTNQFTVTIGA